MRDGVVCEVTVSSRGRARFENMAYSAWNGLWTYGVEPEERTEERAETLTLICPTRTHADVAHVARFHDGEEGLHLKSG